MYIIPILRLPFVPSQPAPPPFTPKPDTAEWVRHKLTDASWQRWRDENPDLARQALAGTGAEDE
jgi:hypothetical protein